MGDAVSCDFLDAQRLRLLLSCGCSLARCEAGPVSLEEQGDLVAAVSSFFFVSRSGDAARALRTEGTQLAGRSEALMAPEHVTLAWRLGPRASSCDSVALGLRSCGSPWLASEAPPAVVRNSSVTLATTGCRWGLSSPIFLGDAAAAITAARGDYLAAFLPRLAEKVGQHGSFFVFGRSLQPL